MKCSWFPDVGIEETLYDDSIAGGAGSLRLLSRSIEHIQMTQASPTIRGGSIEIFDRGNISTRYRVSVRAEFATVDECFLFMDDRMDMVKGKGTLEFGYHTGAFRTLYGAMIEHISFSEDYAVSTVVNYTFTGRELAR